MLFEKLRFAVFKFNLLLEDNTYISSWLTSTLRGGFGTVFKNIVCINKDSSCKKCILRDRCPYSYLFESLPPENAPIFKKISNIPQPFIIEEPQKSNPKELTFNLILIGKAIDYLPYFIFTFDTLGKIGLGKKKSKFFLESVSDSKDEIYNGKTMLLSKDFSIIKATDIIPKIQKNSSPKITLDFITPTRIKSGGSLTISLTFPLLITSLLRRLSLLNYFHCDEEKICPEDVRELIHKAQSIKIVRNELEWYDLERYSSRQKTHLKMGGFKGVIQYEGNIDPFLFYLYLGEYLHLGKNTTFGLGKYRIIHER